MHNSTYMLIGKYNADTTIHKNKLKQLKIS